MLSDAVTKWWWKLKLLLQQTAERVATDILGAGRRKEFGDEAAAENGCENGREERESDKNDRVVIREVKRKSAGAAAIKRAAEHQNRSRAM